MYYVPVDELVGGAVLGSTSLFLPGYSAAQRVLVPAVGATVHVYERGTTTHADCFENSTGSGAPVAQPLQTNADGQVVDTAQNPVFVGQPQELDIVVSGGGLVTPRTIAAGSANDPTSAPTKAAIIASGVAAADLGGEPAGTAAAVLAAARAAANGVASLDGTSKIPAAQIPTLGSTGGVSTAQIGDGASSSFVVNHGLGVQYVKATLINNTTLAQEDCDVVYTDANHITLSAEAWVSSPPALNAYTVNITGNPSVYIGPLSRGAANGVGSLDATGHQPLAELNAGVVTDARGVADQDILVRSGGTWARLAVGSAGQQVVVRSDGTLKYTDAPSVSVKAWGAAGDGSNATTAITAAINALPAGGATLNFGRGNFVVTPSVLPALPSGTRVTGEGMGNTTITMAPNTATGNAVYYLFIPSDAATDLSFEGITFDGNKRNGNHGASEDIAALWLSTANAIARLKVNRCRFYNFRGDGAYLNATNGAPDDVEFTHCVFDDCGASVVGDTDTNARMGLAIIRVSNLRVAMCRFKTIGSFAIDLEANGAGDTFTDFVLEGNVGSGLGAGMVNCSPTTGANATGGIIAGNVTLDACPSPFIVKGTGVALNGNIAPFATTRALLITGSTSVSVSGGVYGIAASAVQHNDQTAPIFLTVSTRCSVSGPVCIDGTGACQGAVYEDSASNFNVKRGVATNLTNPYYVQTGGGANSTDDYSPTFGPRITFGTTSASLVSANVLNYYAAVNPQHIFFSGSPAASTELMRINSSGHLVMNGTRSMRTGSGATGARPALGSNTGPGLSFFDTTLNKPIWVNTANTGWVDATGAAV
jgi:hypothetical protein